MLLPLSIHSESRAVVMETEGMVCATGLVEPGGGIEVSTFTLFSASLRCLPGRDPGSGVVWPLWPEPELLSHLESWLSTQFRVL